MLQFAAMRSLECFIRSCLAGKFGRAKKAEIVAFVLLAALTACNLVSCTSSSMKAHAIDGAAGAGGSAGKDAAVPSGGAGGSSGSGGISGFDATAGSGGLPGTGGGQATGGSQRTSGAGGSGAAAGTSGTASTRGTGGTLVSGGSIGSGGKIATGGAPGSGGGFGSGGRIATGGVIGTGGVVSTGGVRPAGGATGTGGSTVCRGNPLSGGKQYCSNGDGDAGNGYSYRLWAQTPGSACLTIYGVDAAFSASWTNPSDFLAFVGLSFDGSKTYNQLGTFSSDLAFNKTGSGGSGFMGIYGSSTNPQYEFYIIEDWFGSRPAPGDKATTITVDGADYDVYSKQETTTGDLVIQIYSVRRTARQCGHISISDHFAGWAAAGLQLGKIRAVNVYVEGTDNSGSVDFMTATVIVD